MQHLLRTLGFAGGVIVWVAVSSAAQQDAPAVRAGTQGIAVPALSRPVGLENVESWVGTPRVATLDVSVARDGVVQGVRNTSKAPWDQWPQLVEAARLWRFEPRPATTPSLVIVPVTVRFGPPMPTFFDDAAPPVEAPADFSLVYTFGRCQLDARAGTFTARSLGGDVVATQPLILAARERDLIYREMIHVGFFEYPPKIDVDWSRLPELPVGTTVETTRDGILIVVGIELATGRIPSDWHEFTTWSLGRQSTVGWNDSSFLALSREVAGVQRVVGVIQSIVLGHAVVGPMLLRSFGCGSLR